MKLSTLAQQLGAQLVGEDAEVTDVASSQSATATDLVFVEDPKHLAAALDCNAGAIIAGEFAAAETAKPVVIASQPRLAFAKAAELLHPTVSRPAKVDNPESLIHPTAVIDADASIAASARVGPHAVIEKGSRLGERTAIGAGVFIAQEVVIGDDCDIRANVSIYAGTTIGNRVTVHAGAVLGSDGFGFVRDRQNGRYTKFPQIGRLEIGDDVEIGANSTVDRGALDVTVIARGTKLDNLVHVGHNVQIGEDVVIAAQTGISGSAVIENTVVIAGQVGIGDHVRIEKGAILGAQCGVPTAKVIRGPGVVFWGTPARPIKEYLKELAVLARLAKKKA
ncbi:MAG: UDP-3-O-(3-hydroxymyristoyl)glucosamine N-acyltransferase [Terriglobales bacterium]